MRELKQWEESQNGVKSVRNDNAQQPPALYINDGMNMVLRLTRDDNNDIASHILPTPQNGGAYVAVEHVIQMLLLFHTKQYLYHNRRMPVH
jgi:hypothetical protein